MVIQIGGEPRVSSVTEAKGGENVRGRGGGEGSPKLLKTSERSN